MASKPITLTQDEKDMVMQGLTAVMASAERKGADSKNPANIRAIYKAVAKNAQLLASRLEEQA